ncbi:TPA: enoyl-CoA hydratase-related protein [Escherichia coli]
MMEFILSHVEKGVMTLTLNRPERLNSFNDEMHAQLAECLKQVERDDTIRCLLLTGAGRGFCAGQDLNDRNFGLGLIKQAINSAETNTLDTQLDLERDYQRLAGRSADYREGVSAFLAKRSPQFTGK